MRLMMCGAEVAYLCLFTAVFCPSAMSSANNNLAVAFAFAFGSSTDIDTSRSLYRTATELGVERHRPA